MSEFYYGERAKGGAESRNVMWKYGARVQRVVIRGEIMEVGTSGRLGELGCEKGHGRKCTRLGKKSVYCAPDGVEYLVLQRLSISFPLNQSYCNLISHFLDKSFPIKRTDAK